MTTLATSHALLRSSPYQSYVYGYPHKTAYRPLTPAPTLEDVWSTDKCCPLFLYIHIPYCEQRCGFCNLFTTASHAQGHIERYLDVLHHHARATIDALGVGARFHRLAIGGGTPTFLEPEQLERLFNIVSDVMGPTYRDVPASVEASPATATRERLQLLRACGVDRLSLGVQTFDESESKLLGRTQRRSDVHGALSEIRDAGFPTLNIDLIYGGDGQTAESWLASLDEALQYNPEEIYLYPLYVRPCTGLAKLQRKWDDERIALYRLARDRLRQANYEQVSMRMFRRGSAANDEGPVYCCQDDGMVGLGCGARSYTKSLHYSSEYAVGRAGVRQILDAYLTRTVESFGVVDYGVQLDRHEQGRRFVLMSLLQLSGLDAGHYLRRFGADVFEEFPELAELETVGLATQNATTLTLTDAGVERSDAIGPWLWSNVVRRRMGEWSWR